MARPGTARTMGAEDQWAPSWMPASCTTIPTRLPQMSVTMRRFQPPAFSSRPCSSFVVRSACHNLPVDGLPAPSHDVYEFTAVNFKFRGNQANAHTRDLGDLGDLGSRLVWVRFRRPQSGNDNYKGQPLSAAVTRLGWPPDEVQTIDGQKAYTWTVGQSTSQCKVRVVMAGDVIDTYEGFGDIHICSQYGAASGGLKGYN